jgi:hypothetical protein
MIARPTAQAQASIGQIVLPQKARKPSVKGQKKPSVKARKSRSGTGSNLLAVRDVDFEKNSSGGFEAWHVPPGVTHRKDKTYLGYVGKRLIETWQSLPAEARQKAMEDWIQKKRAEKGIE